MLCEAIIIINYELFIGVFERWDDKNSCCCNFKKLNLEKMKEINFIIPFLKVSDKFT